MPLTDSPAGGSELAPHTILSPRQAWAFIWSWLTSPPQAAFLVVRSNFYSQYPGTAQLSRGFKKTPNFPAARGMR